MTPLAMWVCAALAGVTIDGSTGLITTPTAETIEQGAAQAAVGMQLGRFGSGVGLAGLPAGIGAGLLPRLEVGARVERDARLAWPDDDARSSARIHVRYALLARHRSRPAISVQAEVPGLGTSPGASLGVLASLSLARALQLHTSVFARTASGRDPDGYAGIGLEVRFSERVSALAEASLAVDARGLHVWNSRGGLAVSLVDRLSVLAWGGGGRDDGAPWVAGGWSLRLHSKAPSDTDRDGDAIADWSDRCPREPEDVDTFEDRDGCADRDNDGDGIADALDETPNGEPPPQPRVRQLDDHPRFKMRIKPRPMPGPVDPKQRGGS